MVFSFIHDVTAVQINCVYGSYTEKPKTAECLSVGLNIAATGVNIDDSMGTLRPGYEVIRITVISQIVNYLPVRYSKFPELTSIMVQDSAQNFLLKTDFNNLPKLKELRLKFGQIVEIHEDTFISTPRLEVLSIQSQKIHTLPLALLHGLNLLRSVSFYGNQIEVIDAAMFKDNHQLTSVDFDSNHLTIIGATLLDQLTVLKAASFYNNPCIFMSSVTSSVQAVRDAINSPDVCKSATSTGIIAPSVNIDSKDATIAKLTGFVDACEVKVTSCSKCEEMKAKLDGDIKKLKDDNTALQTQLTSCGSQQQLKKCSDDLASITKKAVTCATDADAAKKKCDATAATNDSTIKKCTTDLTKVTKDCIVSIGTTQQKLTECYKFSNSSAAFSKIKIIE